MMSDFGDQITASSDVGGDEFELSAGVRIEELMKNSLGTTGYVGGVYREIMGTRFAGAALGIGY